MPRVDVAPPLTPTAPAPVRAAYAFGVTVDQASRRLSVEGEFDTSAVGHFLVAAAILTDGRVGDVTVDLAALRFIDAAGLGALVTVRNVLFRGGHRLVVNGVRPAARRVFQLGSLSELLSDAA